MSILQVRITRILQAPLFKQKYEFSGNKRDIWGYVAIAFNRVDSQRLLKVGPNRLCAEWIIKNGGAVRFTENSTKLWKDYNSLPLESTKFSIKEVDASNSTIMKIGFEHFIGCNNIDTVILHNCKHLESDSLDGLLHLKNSLKYLHISGCYNITDDGLAPIGELKQLKDLCIFDMAYVKNIEEVQNKLKKKLPNCKIESNVK